MARKLQLSELGVHDPLTGGVVSVEGVRLFDVGEALHEQEIAVMKDFGFDPVFLCDNDIDQEETIASLRYTPRPIDQLGDDEAVALSIYDDGNQAMIEAGETLSAKRREQLKAQGILEVMVESPLDEEVELRLGRFFMRLSAIRKQTRVLKRKFTPTVRLDEERIIDDPTTITEDHVEALVEAGSFDDAPSGEPLLEKFTSHDSARPRPVAHVREMVELHNDVVRMAEQIFAQIRASEKVSRDLISGLSSKVVTGLINDSAMVLNLSGLENSKHYIVSHAINTALLSISIAATMGYSQGQVLEIAYGALLHDIGMMRIPPEIVTKREPLTAKERLEIQRHPVIGLNILQSVSGVPKSAPMIVYQENERTDSSGYPKARGPGLIHTYAKIVAVASTYDAMTHDRPWRKAKLPYYAMEELLQLVSQKKFDSAPARALLKVMSLFPVGSWLSLADGSIARVVGANEQSFTRPTISIILDAAGNQVETPTPLNLSASENEDLRIIEPVPRPEGLQGDLRTIGF